MKISLIYSPAPREVREWALELPDGASLAQALQKSLIFEEFPELQTQQTHLPVGIWGKRAGLSRMLHDKDRIEVYRSLRVDPKVARRERFSHQGIKRAGLFAASRLGAKAGY
ncbi:MAG: RnfH family protein [Polaromonas sp.]|nr:RnfH family protein [Polaromonas sp.]